MVKFVIKGVICPVFTPFTEDKKNIDYDCIDKYCHFLKTKGCCGVLVNGTVGEVTCLRVDERKRLAEEWLKCCRKHGLLCCLVIGGCDLCDTYILAEHAEKIGVDCVCILPELLYKPRCEEDLCEYFKEICKYCPSVPAYYYHVPRRTCVDLHVGRFCEMIERTCHTFCGVFYECCDLGVACELMTNTRNIVLCCDTIITSCLALGCDAICCITFNVFPDCVKECWDLMTHGKLREACDKQFKLNQRIREICTKYTSDWVDCMKRECNKVCTSFKVGCLRKPICTYYKKW